MAQTRASSYVHDNHENITNRKIDLASQHVIGRIYIKLESQLRACGLSRGSKRGAEIVSFPGGAAVNPTVTEIQQILWRWYVRI